MPTALGPAAIREFRVDLCRVAARRFAELGYAGVTLRALAEELGCSRMTPYRYFKDKADILAAVRADGFRRLAEYQEAAPEPEADPIARVQAVSRPEFRRLLAIGQASGELGDLLQRIGQRYERQADRLIDRLTTLLEPAVILTLAFLIGLVVVAAVLPMVRLQEVLG